MNSHNQLLGFESILMNAVLCALPDFHLQSSRFLMCVDNIGVSMIMSN